MIGRENRVRLGEKAGGGVSFYGRMGEDGSIENLFAPCGAFQGARP
ncbi:hypothetical protein ASZ90_001361 [hydrocarbon metagenome]|uniref:Uncharacterized protein n=1 Tax=hydrocarbon metagenome TaxID=938273 RepID=A0A0W8G6L1_9ZZZZ